MRDQPVLSSRRRMTLLAALCVGVIGGAAADTAVSLRGKPSPSATAAAALPGGAEPGTLGTAYSPSERAADAASLGIAPDQADGQLDTSPPSPAPSPQAANNADAGGCSCVEGDDDEEVAKSPLKPRRAAGTPRKRTVHVTRCATPVTE